MDDLSFTKVILKSEPEAFRRATQSEFLRLGAEGTLPKEILGKWLGNDRLYIHAYIRGLGRTLSLLKPPQVTGNAPSRETRILDWLVRALVNIRREEKFFVETAEKFGIDIALEADKKGIVADETKLEGLRRFETLFDSIGSGKSISPPWVEAAIIFWGTEKCYLEAWTWAKSQLKESDGSGDADGGALRNEFIPNWTSDEFVHFVDELGRIIDDVVAEQIKISGVQVIADLVQYFGDRWRELLEAEEKFWPAV